MVHLLRPGYPQPNYFIDAPAMDPLMVPWITWRYGMQGILYWDMKDWEEVKSPWIDPVTFREGIASAAGAGMLNGEGSLLYPGSQTGQTPGRPMSTGRCRRSVSSCCAKASRITSTCGC